MMGRIVSINISRKKHVTKAPVDEARLIEDLGIEGDAHAAPGDRQVSLLMEESIDKMRALLTEKWRDEPDRKRPKKLDLDLDPGAFAENLTVEGLDLLALSIGDELTAAEGVLLRVSKIGKECHHGCAIYKTLGDCIMPREGIFCEVVRGGVIHPGDSIGPR